MITGADVVIVLDPDVIVVGTTVDTATTVNEEAPGTSLAKLPVRLS